ncbi:MAG: ABC transporter permease [Lewinellaceae bacterium]|nr:ABC transporter permease [Lewinellaceae bacterium]MCB9291343.1 ABC transporter permease [Lewinellaceae bacterium]
MLANFIKTAVRNFWRNKTFSLINLFGLALGTVCCLYILLFVQDHLGYDGHHQDAENLYRVISTLEFSEAGEAHEMATCSPPIPPALQVDFPEVELAARVCRPPSVDQHLLKAGEKVFYEKAGLYVDSTFLLLFDYQFLDGDPRHALDEPFSVILSERLAKKLFAEENAVGKSIRIGGGGEEHPFKVTGVFNSHFGKSHLASEFYMSMNSGGLGQYIRSNNSWAGNNFIYGYLRLRPDADPVALEAKLPGFLEKHGSTQLRDLGMNKQLHLQPVTDIHLSTRLNADMPTNTSATFLKVLLLIAGFIQLVACINFMNLSTARSTRRAKEVGVRKAVGAPRSMLMGQFLTESFLMTLMAVALAVPLAVYSLPFLNRLTGADVNLNFSWSWPYLGIALGLAILTGIVAGSYPAFYLSSFRPIGALRQEGKAGRKKGAAWLRRGLIVGQLGLATALVIGALVIRLQLNYMLEKDLGFEQNQKVVFHFHSGEGSSNLEAFRGELMRLPEVNSASAMSETPGQPILMDIPLYKQGGDMQNATDVRLVYTDDNFFRALKADLLAGRAPTLADTSGSRGIIRVVLNESAVKRLDIPVEEAPGMVLYSDFEDIHIEATVVGVMKDIVFEKQSSELGPFMIVAEPPRNLRNLVADVNTDNYKAFMDKARALWAEVVPGLPFDASFLDADIERMYQTERSLSRIIGAFTLIAILISCLGLFGLSAFSAEQRTKEIGIRKVLGASVASIVGLLSKDFLRLVLIGLLVASPLAYYFLEKWLDNFAYRIDFHWWVFPLAGAIALIVAFLTVSFQSVKAALADPVRSLRSE